jgi:hypothetical protein
VAAPNLLRPTAVVTKPPTRANLQRTPPHHNPICPAPAALVKSVPQIGAKNPCQALATYPEAPPKKRGKKPEAKKQPFDSRELPAGNRTTFLRSCMRAGRPAPHNGPAGGPMRCCGRGRPVLPARTPSEPDGFAVTGPSDWCAGSCPLGLPSKIPNALHALRRPVPHNGLLQASFSGHDAELTAQPLIAKSYPASRSGAPWFRPRRVRP